MRNSFVLMVKTALVLVYLVIVAGAVVRMTGSGMGCPDWPKCFGYYIPPTNIETLQWQANRSYEKGQVIIYGKTLKVAQSDFVTGPAFSTTNWENYTKHDYAVFNVWHTWIEYINRLFGALAGLATLIMAVYSIRWWKKRRTLTILSWLVVFAMGFQGWLGATVVYSVLEPIKITLHMVMALAIVALLILLLYKSSEQKILNSNKMLFGLIALSLLLTLVQIVLGTQVRQFVDEQIGVVGENAKNLWLQDPNIQFYVHRTFSIAVLLLNGYLFYNIRKKGLELKKINWVMLLIASEIFTGMLMYYVDFPFTSQPLHLVLASLLFGVQFYMVLEASPRVKSHKSL